MFRTSIFLILASLGCGHSTSDGELDRRKPKRDAGIIAVDAPTPTPVDAPTPTPVDAPTTPPVDAPTTPPVDAPATPPVDAPTTPPANPGVVSCYSQGAPAAECAAPAYCCFDNYSSQHNGYCTSTASCTWGTITCDGPEDCGGGEECCATAKRDPQLGTTGYVMACRAGSCGGAPLDHELCHPGANTCANGSCVTAFGNANDLPRTLYVCQ